MNEIFKINLKEKFFVIFCGFYKLSPNFIKVFEIFRKIAKSGYCVIIAHDHLQTKPP